MESSYREKLENLQFTDEEIGVVVKSTLRYLRRRNIAGTLCPRCANDDQEGCSVTEIDEVGFITNVKCGGCAGRLSTICRSPRCRYEAIQDPSTLSTGDHITWHRPYFIWHHAVVMEQDRNAMAITIHEYNLSNDGPYAAIVQTKLTYAEFVLQRYYCII